MPDVRWLARRERLQFADLLADLTAQQWSAPSLCAGWTVRDVVAHTLAYLSQSRIRLTGNMIRARGDVDRLNAALCTRAESSTDALVAQMRAYAEPAGAGALYGGRVALIECLVHQQDVRRPLGLLRPVDADALRTSLRYARFSPVVGGGRRTRGLRLVADDVNWSAGRGPEVRGPGEAVLLAMTGRVAAVSGELTGDGVALLR